MFFDRTEGLNPVVVPLPDITFDIKLSIRKVDWSLILKDNIDESKSVLFENEVVVDKEANVPLDSCSDTFFTASTYLQQNLRHTLLIDLVLIGCIDDIAKIVLKLRINLIEILYNWQRCAD